MAIALTVRVLFADSINLTRGAGPLSGELKWVVREFIREDAAKLARLLNESEEGWPGGLTGGVPYT
ncbi:MAG: hypothetical protein DRJ56_02210, partial [Thermoprotei archaeon]